MYFVYFRNCWSFDPHLTESMPVVYLGLIWIIFNHQVAVVAVEKFNWIVAKFLKLKLGHPVTPHKSIIRLMLYIILFFYAKHFCHLNNVQIPRALYLYQKKKKTKTTLKTKDVTVVAFSNKHKFNSFTFILLIFLNKIKQKLHIIRIIFYFFYFNVNRI